MRFFTVNLGGGGDDIVTAADYTALSAVVGDYDGQLGVTIDTEYLYMWDLPTTTWVKAAYIHADLGGLTADDHTQYVANSTSARTAGQTVATSFHGTTTLNFPILNATLINGHTGIIHNIGATAVNAALFSGTTSIINNIGATAVNAALFSGTTSIINNIGATSIVGHSAAIHNIGATSVIGHTGSFTNLNANTFNSANSTIQNLGTTVTQGYLGAFSNITATLISAVGATINNITATLIQGHTGTIHNIGATSVVGMSATFENMGATTINAALFSGTTGVISNFGATSITTYDLQFPRLASAPGNASASFIRTYYLDNVLYQKDENGTAYPVGAGGEFDINYITAYNAEDNTGGATGWTVSAAGVSFAVNGVSAIFGSKSFEFYKGAANYSGVYAYYPFTIDPWMKNKTMSWTMYATPDSNYQTDWLSFKAYDATSATLITVRGSFGSNGRGTFSFPTSNADDYQIRMEVATDSTTAFSVLMDQFKVGPDKLVDSPIMSFNNEFTGNINNFDGGWTTETNPTYNRIGEKTFIRYEWTVNGAGTDTLTDLTVDLPSNQTPAISASRQIGTYFIGDNSIVSATNKVGSLWWTGTEVKFFEDSANDFLVSGDIPAGAIITLDISYNVTEWANQSAVRSTTEMMNETVKVNAYASAVTSIASTPTVVGFNTTKIDTNDAWDTSNYRFVAPKTGYFWVAAQVGLDDNSYAAGDRLITELYKQGSFEAVLGRAVAWSTTTQELVAGGAPYLVQLNKDEYIDIRARQDYGSNINTNINNCHVSISEEPDFSVYSVHGDATPEGVISAWLPGYFGNSSNGSFSAVLSANTIAGANAHLNPKGYYVCDGSELNHAESRIFAGSGRYLPNLTDDRFLMGDTTGGSVGGSNTLVDHTHGTGTLNITASGSHTHALTGFGTGVYDTTTGGTTQPNNPSYAFRRVDIYTTAGKNAYLTLYGTMPTATHTHSNGNFAGVVGTGSAATSTESRPKYLSCFYIMKVR